MPSKTPTARFVLAPRRMKPKDKRVLADYVKSLPLTTNPKVAKIFKGKQGAYKFLARHPQAAKRLKAIPAAAILR